MLFHVNKKEKSVEDSSDSQWLEELKGKKIIITGEKINFSGIISAVQDVGVKLKCIFDTGDIFYLSKVCAVSKDGKISVIGTEENSKTFLYLELAIAS